MTQPNKKTVLSLHILGAGLVTGTLYLVFSVALFEFYISGNPSVWAPYGLFLLYDPLSWIAFVGWFIINRKILMRFGWSSPGSALTLALIASLIVSFVLDEFIFISDFVPTPTRTHTFYTVLLVLLLFFRNIDRKRT